MCTCWDGSSASFALGSVHQKSWMPSLKYSNAAYFKLHHCFHQRQMEAGRELELLFITTGQQLVQLPTALTDCHSIGHPPLSPRRTSCRQAIAELSMTADALRKMFLHERGAAQSKLWKKTAVVTLGLK